MSTLYLPRRITGGQIHRCEVRGDRDVITARLADVEFGRRFDRDAIERALADLGITSPVRIRLTNGVKTGGSHRFKGGEHIITLSRRYSAHVMSRDLWHELTHAWQREAEGPDYVKRYRRYQQLLGYASNPYEREARQASFRAEEEPLVVLDRALYFDDLTRSCLCVIDP